MQLQNNKDVVPDYITFNINRYGMGKSRTLEDYYKYAGIVKLPKISAPLTKRLQY